MVHPNFSFFFLDRRSTGQQSRRGRPDSSPEEVDRTTVHNRCSVIFFFFHSTRVFGYKPLIMLQARESQENRKEMKKNIKFFF